MNADAGDGHMILQGSLPAGVYAPCHAFVPHLTATLREQDYFASNDGHFNARECVTFAGRDWPYERQILDPPTIPS